MPSRPCITSVLILLAAANGQAFDDGRHRAALLDGVAGIAAPGVPGPLSVFGDRAFVVIAGGSGGKLREPVVAAAEYERGRVVAFGHTGYLGSAGDAETDTGRLLLNAVRWVAKSNGENRKIRVGVRRQGKLLAYLRGHGIDAKSLDGAKWSGRLSEFDVLCCGSHRLTDDDIDAVRSFVRRGDGLVTAGLAWGWLQLNPGKSLNDHPGNRLLAPCGIVWADGTLKRTTERGFDAKAAPPDLCHAARAIDAIDRRGEAESRLSKADAAQAVRTASKAARSLPADDTLLRPRLARLRKRHNKPIVPTEKDAISMNKPLERLLLTLEMEEVRGLPPERVRPHPAAESFPGGVPTGAERVSETIEINTGTPGRHGTGLYAAPGEVIAIEIPGRATHAKLAVRIGAHSDRLWNKDAWKRCPDICRTFRLDEKRNKAANAFGGLVYIEVPKGCRSGVVSVRIGGAVPAPRFVLGETDLDAWRRTIRKRLAPWAELESNKIALTVPSSEIRDLDDPESLMRCWDDIADACATLAQRPLTRERPERYVADRQISAGYMHAGYPIMTHLDAAATLVSRERLLEGAWGLYHELGHNHQSRDWTFAGTGEVTCNLFTLFVYDKVCGRYGESRPKLFGEDRKKTIREYLNAGADFQTWKKKPFLALLPYMQIKEAFGWEAFERVFVEYRGLPVDQRPKNDDQKRDQWLIRLSRTVGRNLGPFFQAWGIPTSDEARDAVAELPAWMPKNFPPD